MDPPRSTRVIPFSASLLTLVATSMSTGLFQRPLRLTAAAALRPLLTARLLPTSPLASSYPHGRFLLPAVARVSPRRAAFSTANSTAPSGVEPCPQGPAAPADVAAARARELAESSSQQRRALILEEVQRADQDRSAVERLSFCVIDALGEIKHPHLSYTKGEICTTYNVSRKSVFGRGAELTSHVALSSGSPSRHPHA